MQLVQLLSSYEHLTTVAVVISIQVLIHFIHTNFNDVVLTTEVGIVKYGEKAAMDNFMVPIT
jgi:hypothetical protein